MASTPNYPRKVNIDIMSEFHLYDYTVLAEVEYTLLWPVARWQLTAALTVTRRSNGAGEETVLRDKLGPFVMLLHKAKRQGSL